MIYYYLRTVDKK